MCIIKKDGRFKHINPAFVKLTEYDREQIDRMTLSDIFNAEERVNVKETIDNLFAGKTNGKEAEHSIITASGELKLLNCKFLHLQNEGEIYLAGQDLTEKKKIQYDANDQRNKLFHIIDLVPHPIFLKDEKGTYLMVNQAQATLFETSKEDLIGKSDDDFIKNEEELKGIHVSDEKVLKEILTVELPEQVITHLNGKRRTLFTTKLPFLSKADGKMNILGVSIDLTEIKEAEKELRKINFELDSFVYHSSHDLRAPLCSLNGLLNLIDLEKDSSVKEKCINEARKSIKRMDGFINDLTNLSRNSRLGVQPEKIKFRKLILGVFDDLCHMENASRIKVRFDITGEFDFHSDKGRIRVILMNLISNAIKYQRYEVPDVVPEINIRIIKRNEGVQIVISDNGLGIDPEYLNKIFDMFFRANENTSGSGLGLYIVKQIIERLGGLIAVNSEKEHGTTFQVVIPNCLSTINSE